MTVTNLEGSSDIDTCNNFESSNKWEQLRDNIVSKHIQNFNVYI